MEFKAAWQALFGRSEPAKPVAVEPQIPVYKPTFVRVAAYGPGWGMFQRYLNPTYFATAETAEWVLANIGGSKIFSIIAPGNEGPTFTASAKERCILVDKDPWKSPNGRFVNAGWVADRYACNAGLTFVIDGLGYGHWEDLGNLKGTTQNWRHANGIRAAKEALEASTDVRSINFAANPDLKVLLNVPEGGGGPSYELYTTIKGGGGPSGV